MHRIALFLVILSLLSGRPSTHLQYGRWMTGPSGKARVGGFRRCRLRGRYFVAIGHSPVGTIYRSPTGDLERHDSIPERCSPA